MNIHIGNKTLTVPPRLWEVARSNPHIKQWIDRQRVGRHSALPLPAADSAEWEATRLRQEIVRQIEAADDARRAKEWLPTLQRQKAYLASTIHHLQTDPTEQARIA